MKDTGSDSDRAADPTKDAEITIHQLPPSPRKLKKLPLRGEERKKLEEFHPEDLHRTDADDLLERIKDAKMEGSFTKGVRGDPKVTQGHAAAGSEPEGFTPP